MAEKDKAVLRVVKRENKNCLNKVVTDMKIRNIDRREGLFVVGTASESLFNCRVVDKSFVVDNGGFMDSETNLVLIYCTETARCCAVATDLSSLGTEPLIAMPKMVGSNKILSSGRTVTGSEFLKVAIVAEQRIIPMEVVASE